MAAECAKHEKVYFKGYATESFHKRSPFFPGTKKKEEKFIVIPQTISLPELLGDSHPYSVYTHMNPPPPCYIKGLFKLQKGERHRTLPLLAAWLHDLVSHLFKERESKRERERRAGVHWISRSGSWFTAGSSQTTDNKHWRVIWLRQVTSSSQQVKNSPRELN